MQSEARIITVKIQIPDSLKTDMPQTVWGKILSATPIVMTVIATMLAGLASSEMTRAQYDRSLAAQQQSKAGDQWSFFQAKRLRGALQRNTLDVLENTTAVPAFDAAALRSAFNVRSRDLVAALRADSGETAMRLLERGELPATGPSHRTDPQIVAVQEAIEKSGPTLEIARLLAQLKPATLDEELRAAHDQTAAFDAALKPVSLTIDTVERSLAQPGTLTAGTPEATLALRRSFTAARLRFNAARYDAEARLNQAVGGLLELQVRKSNLSAERHHFRSQKFFYGMLGAQMAVIIATFAMAAKKRNLLWSLAAAAGVAAVTFAGYVYLFV